MSLLIKICGLSEEQHVAAAVEAGAAAVGFVFAESVRRIKPGKASVICGNVPQDIKRVAVMLHPSNEEWQDVLENFGPDVLQTDVDDFAGLEVPESVECWPVYREGLANPDTTGAYVYEGSQSGQGETVDWSHAAKHARRGRMILAGGLAAHNVAVAVAAVRPYGVDVSSAVETAPGQKNARLIENFVSAARAAEKHL